MITWGINALNHDASIAVVSNGNLIAWERASDYTGIQGDQFLSTNMFSKCLHYGSPNEIVWYERPWIKKSRQLYAKQYDLAFDLNELPRRYINRTYAMPYVKWKYMPHHMSHAAAGFLTSPFHEAAVVVLDAIGEWESASIWKGEGTTLTKVWSKKYPTSLGLFYSAFTKLIGLKPLGEEHILQQYSEFGDPKRYIVEVSRYWGRNWTLLENMHKGVHTWPYEIKTDQDRYDIAASVQRVFEIQANLIIDKAQELIGSSNLVYMGGCAMNSKFNKTLSSDWGGLWSLPVPGDSSSAIGAALYSQAARITWPYQVANNFPLKYNKV